jgi:DNA polymerase III alpha subunit
MIPIFQTNYSIGKGILTLDPPNEKDPTLIGDGPVSILSIAKRHKLTELFVSDYNFGGFPSFYKGCLKEGIKPRFGIKFYVCQNCTDKSDESLRSESKVTVWMLNSDGYQDLCKMYSVSYEEKNFYYQNRLDWPQLKSLWTPNLGLSIDFYDGFLAQNLLRNGCCVPDLSFTTPIFHICDTELPFDFLIKEKTESFCAENKYQIDKTHPIYYYLDADAEAFQTFKVIQNKTTLQKPNLEHFSSNKFSFEEFLRKTT